MTGGIRHYTLRRNLLAIAITLALLTVYPARAQEKISTASQPPGVQGTVIHTFTNAPDGAYPYAGLIMDSSGNLYGTTLTGGANLGAVGTVFEVTP
jgi:hypothetical protein